MAERIAIILLAFVAIITIEMRLREQIRRLEK